MSLTWRSLLSATDIKEFLTRYDFLNMIVEQDVELIKRLIKRRRSLRLKNLT
jgi:peptidoglycan hydrolase CwlO-like protein